ncbi:MAG: fumarylacetoacetate hydrolase family protein [Bacteroidota bacterium]
MINPRNIHCLALNYKGVGSLTQTPLYFVKSLSAYCNEGAEVPYPKDVESMWTEVELTIIIGKEGTNIPVEAAFDYVAGYTVGADITCQNIHQRDHHLGFSKSRYNFCPVLNKVFSISKEDLPSLELITKINGKVTQHGYMSDINYGVAESISYISKITKLEKGDIILTGTPDGVENNIVKPGDKVEHSISGVGNLSFNII